MCSAEIFSGECKSFRCAGKAIRGFRRKKTRVPAARNSTRHFGVPNEIIPQARGNAIALRERANARRQKTPNQRKHQRIMRATENDRIRFFIARKQRLQMPLHEIFGGGRSRFAIFHKRNPHRARLGNNANFRKKFFKLQLVRTGSNRAFRAEHADMLRATERVRRFNRRANHAEHATGRIFRARQILLLNRTQSFGGRRVARENDQRTTLRKQPRNRLPSEFQHDFERTRSVRRARVVSQVEKIALRQRCANFSKIVSPP